MNQKIIDLTLTEILEELEETKKYINYLKNKMYRIETKIKLINKKTKNNETNNHTPGQA